MSSRFQYSYIKPGWIRLLLIVSVDPEIVFRVESVSLDSDPSYLALSYCWGEPIFSKRVSLEIGFLDVTPSLYNAVRNMQGYVGAKIWIDAICINQADNEEKAHQVQAMSRVYHQARKVLMWLGDAADGSDNAMQGVSDYGTAAREAGILRLTPNQFQNWPDLGNEPPDVSTRDRILNLMQKATESEGAENRSHERLPRLAFANLSRREYFTRVWVKQEVTLAQNAIIMCGGEAALLEDFHALILFYGLLQMWEITEFQAGRSTRIPGPFSEAELMASPNMTALMASASLSNMVGVAFSGRRKYLRDGPEPLYELLYQSYVQPSSRVLCCKDPRDKIWGLLGIAGDQKELDLLVNYDKAATDIYENTTRALLRLGRIGVLNWCRSRQPGSPSWVPDYSMPIRRPWSDDTSMPLFKASGDKRQPAHQGEAASQGILKLHGIVVDTIEKVGSTWWADLDEPFNQEVFLKVAADVASFLETSRYTEEQRIDALWRIPIGDKELPLTSPYWVRGSDRSKQQYHALVSEQMSGDLNASTYSYQTCMGYNYMAAPMMTRDGYVGLGPSEARAGDVVVIFLGGTTPHVLRPRPDDQGGYFLLGEAYVYGVMDGEVLSLSDTTDVLELW
ncbi:Heterokaryon incompatibility protein [Paramyrothecium foliicola]|nr:Heterokaryon incompatibility protein [Paramyrothecium foliicola]